MAKLNRKYLKPFKNIFILIVVVFAVWMIFFDANSYLIHRELNTEIDELETEKEYYNKEIEKDKKAIKELSSELGVEKLAREKYYMKKANEEIFIIEYEDSIPKENKND
ncbi:MULTISPECIES: FtsB family cell division protein [Bizionia]|uniref:Septum formation initiator n=1 Tax=Bizionia algoritergicola TaxID=291187 RepID=A0A5D0QS36_9FLAO|nr:MULTISPECIES: septum formation initiator family protein [Bizionia]OBX21149.1 septum formation initiator [Bizionia sp. APA-3]TYB71715.1 septum formation initiator [Bizionia algoritergicola]